MVQRAKRLILGENTLVSLGFLIAIGAPVLGGTVWATNLANRVTRNAEDINRIDTERNRCLTEIKQSVSNLQVEFLKLRSDFVQRDNRRREREERGG